MKPLVLIAHRGRLDTLDRENSISQMEITLSRGVSMMEIDLRRSSDGTVYLLHDPTLDRTTNTTGPIDSKSDSELKSVFLRSADGTVTNEHLPRFQDVLDLAHANPKLHLMLDIKAEDPRDLIPVLAANHLTDRSLIITFDRDAAQKAFSFHHDVLVSVLVRNPSEIESYLATRNGNPIAFYVPQDADPSLFAAAARTGRPVITDAVVEGVDGSLEQKALASGPQIYSEYLRDRPVDYFVSDLSLVVRGAACEN